MTPTNDGIFGPDKTLHVPVPAVGGTAANVADAVPDERQMLTPASAIDAPVIGPVVTSIDEELDPQELEIFHVNV